MSWSAYFIISHVLCGAIYLSSGVRPAGDLNPLRGNKPVRLLGSVMLGMFAMWWIGQTNTGYGLVVTLAIMMASLALYTLGGGLRGAFNRLLIIIVPVTIAGLAHIGGL